MIEYVFGGLLLWSFRKQAGIGSENYGVLTPERETMYLNALEHLKDPVRMRKLADEFDKFGLKVQAKVLRARATWNDRPKEKVLEHRQIFEKAMNSENIPAILQVAKAFESMTATVNAKRLRDRVEFLRNRPKEETKTPVSLSDTGLNGVHKPVEKDANHGREEKASEGQA